MFILKVCVCLGRDSAQIPAGFSAVINEGVFVCPVKLTLVCVLLTPVLFVSISIRDTQRSSGIFASMHIYDCLCYVSLCSGAGKL